MALKYEDDPQAQEKNRYDMAFSGHGRGVVMWQETDGFKERSMTPAELAARKPAMAISEQIHKLACYAAFAYIKSWEFIAPAIQAALDADRWQPIATAPLDGTAVDCWVGGHRLENCFYGKPYHECLSEFCDSCPEDLERECWRWSFGNEPIHPTHWMPLPAAPLS